MITNTVSLPAIVVMAWLHSEDMRAGAATMRTLPTAVLLVIGGSTLGALLISCTYMKVYKIASATAVTVCGNVSKGKYLHHGVVLHMGGVAGGRCRMESQE